MYKPILNDLRENRCYAVRIPQIMHSEVMQISDIVDYAGYRFLERLIEPLIQYMELCVLDYSDEAIRECSKGSLLDRNKTLALGSPYEPVRDFGRFIDVYDFERLDRAQSGINLARLVIKIKSYKRDNGRYPDSLKQLGSNSPSDPFTGKTYNYSRIDHGFALYGKGNQMWPHRMVKNPSLEQKLEHRVLIGWIYKN